MLSTPGKWPLDQLTPEQGQTLFALAFGYAPPLDQLKQFSTSSYVVIASDIKTLMIYSDGQIQASRVATKEEEPRSIAFNAAKVTMQLGHWQVQFGPETPTAL